MLQMVSEHLRPWLIVCSVHLAGEKILKLQSNEDIVFLGEVECDTPDLALKMNDRLLILSRCIFVLGVEQF